MSPSQVKIKAKELAKNTDFLASDTWLHHFLKRNNLSIRKKTQDIKAIKENFHSSVQDYFEKLDEIMAREKEDVLFLNLDEVNLPVRGLYY